MQNIIEKIELELRAGGVPNVPARVFERILLHLRQRETYPTALAESRKIAEWILKELYSQQRGVRADALGYVPAQKMLQALESELPMQKQAVLRSLQAIQNYYSHVEGDTDDVDESTVQGALLLVVSLFDDIRSLSRSEERQNISRAKPVVIGVDVGTSKIAAGVISLKDPTKPKLLARSKLFHRDIESDSGILEKIERVVSDSVAQSGLDLKEVEGVGVGLPGQVDHRTGLLKFAPGLKLRNIAVATRLRTALGVNVYADNDVNCATLAELRWGAGRNFSNFVCVFIGTGIGAGIVIDGQLYRGANFAAGEIGHTKVDLSAVARECTCGARGCLEEYASARAILRMGREAVFEARERKLGGFFESIDPESLTSELLTEAVRAGDRQAILIAENLAASLAVGLSNVANFMNPEALILGGGLVRGFYGIDAIADVFARKFRDSTLDVCSQISILTSSFDTDTPVIGAASLVPIEADSPASR